MCEVTTVPMSQLQRAQFLQGVTVAWVPCPVVAYNLLHCCLQISAVLLCSINRLHIQDCAPSF